jgi:hypothetical protein
MNTGMPWTPEAIIYAHESSAYGAAGVTGLGFL